MRILLRLLLTWLILLPIALYFGFPMILSHLQEKLRDETYTQCLTQTAATPGFNPTHAQPYCQCLRDGVILTRDDAFAIVRQQPPLQMQATLQAQVDRCSATLQ